MFGIVSAPQLPPLIVQMQEPDFYPHSVSLPIRLVQTHISYVLLTGEFAYKIKKPLNLGFLDFSNLEKRRYFCYEELRLNQRLSPELYLDVLPIYLSGQTYRFGSTEEEGTEPVEYALLMREFSQESVFSRMFERNELNEEHFRRLAVLLARFHESARSDESVAANGTVKAITSTADGNYEIARRYIGRLQTENRFNKTKDFTDRFLQDHAEWFERRIAEGKIRECHGDVHLNNICMWRNQIQLFDCIEFDAKFRNIDILYEIAFLKMDLDFRSRRDFANIFLNAYLEQTEDYWGAALLPFYCSLRATVRAKVTSLILDEETVTEKQKQQAADDAEKYYELASMYADKRKGFILIMCGLSASGKTTAARILSPKLDAIHIRSDAVRKRLTGGQEIGAKNYGEGIYAPEITEQTYARLTEPGVFLAKQGNVVILDATFLKRKFRQRAMKQAESVGVDCRIVFCAAPVGVLEQRLINRSNDISDATIGVLHRQQAEMEHFDDSELPFVSSIDTTKDADAQIAELIRSESWTFKTS
jgi:aminoglycoside phosphotransferase family enzyme/predicted kinase